MDPAIIDFKSFTKKILEQLKEDFKTIRSGKANSSLLEGIEVLAYGGSTRLKLKELSTITADGPTILAITPFDPSTSKDIEKAIQMSPLGLNPQPQGTRITINLPPMSEEQREKMVKLIASKVEEKKVMIRNERDNTRKKIKQMHEQKTITDDDKFRMEKEVDTVSQEATEEVQQIREKKEQELREV